MILLIDRDGEFRQSLQAALTFGGFAVTSAGSYKEAIASVFVAGRPPRCVVLDVDLDEECGLSAINQIRRGYPTIPIIATASKRLGSGMESIAFNCGADEYIEKPYSALEMLYRISNLSVRSEVANTVEAGNIKLDLTTGDICVDDEPVVMCERRRLVLMGILKKKGGVASRSALKRIANVESCSALEILISRIRNQLRLAGANVRIRSVSNGGYHLEVVR